MNAPFRIPTRPGSGAQRGLTLIELMISLVLGLIVIGSVIAVFLSNRQSYQTNTALSQVQDNARVAFELLARDVRQAGLTGCGDQGRIANVLSDGPNNGGTDWYANWNNAIVGYDDASADPALSGTGAGQPVAGTSSIELLGASSAGFSVQTDDLTSASFKITEPSSDLQAGDIIMVCDPDHAAITQVTDYNSSNVTVVNDTGNTVSPGNCSKGLGYHTDCSSTNGNQYQFPQNSTIARLSATDWYIGTNPVGGHSLYRIDVTPQGGTLTPVAQEMVRNVTDMAIRYHIANAADYVDAATVGGNWASVDAVRVVLKLQSADQRAGTDVQPITRNMVTTITLRNRVD